MLEYLYAYASTFSCLIFKYGVISTTLKDKVDDTKVTVFCLNTLVVFLYK